MSDALMRKLDMALEAAEPPRPGISKVNAAIEALVEALREEGFRSSSIRRAEIVISALPGGCIPVASVNEDLILDLTEAGPGDTRIRREVASVLSDAVLDFNMSDDGEAFRKAFREAGAGIVRRAERKMHERRKGVAR